MHILFLTDNFPPESNAPASRTFEHCREWVRAGHRVTVITGVPNFPAGRVFPGYRNRPRQVEELEGIRVVRVWTYIAANAGFARRVLDYLSFMAAAVLAAPFERRVDVVVGTSPQFFTACAAYAVSRCKRVPYVFELRDLWPASIAAVGALRAARLLRHLERLELFLYREAATVVSVTHSFKRDLVRRGIDPAKVHVVTNGVDTVRFRPRPRDPELEARLGLGGRFVAGYVGTHGLAHALETVLEAAARVRETAGGETIRFLLLGDGARRAALRERARRMGLDNVLFLDPVPRHAVARYWSLLDAAIIHLRRAELFATVIPSKLFESMAMGVPVLHGVAGESAQMVEREGVGLTFAPEDSAALSAALLRLQRDPVLHAHLRRRCLAAADGYGRAALARTMGQILEAAAQAHPEP